MEKKKLNKEKIICIIDDHMEVIWGLELLLNDLIDKYNIKILTFFGAKNIISDDILEKENKTIAQIELDKNGEKIDPYIETELYFSDKYKNFRDVEFEDIDLFIVDLRANGIPGGQFAKDFILKKDSNKNVIFYSGCLPKDKYYQKSKEIIGDKIFEKMFYSKTTDNEKMKKYIENIFKGE